MDMGIDLYLRLRIRGGSSSGRGSMGRNRVCARRSLGDVWITIIIIIILKLIAIPTMAYSTSPKTNS
jgi:hypothetical protein